MPRRQIPSRLAEAGKAVLAASVAVAALCLPRPATAQDAAGLDARVDRAIAKIRARALHADRDTPWVVMHAVIAFEQDVRVHLPGEAVPLGAIDYLCTRATYEGKRIYRADRGYPALPTRGLSYGMRASFKVQDHVDQYLMAFADAGVPLDQPIVAEGGQRFTLADALAAAKRTFTTQQELGWTLVAFTRYLGPDSAWRNAAEQRYTMTDLVALAVRRDPRGETEGGPHHLYGVAVALRAHLESGGALEGPWEDADRYLREYAALARQHQPADGSFSVAMFRGSRLAQSPRHLVWATGHTLEWLSRALTPEALKAPWVRRAVSRLCQEIEDKPLSVFSDGGLYHAAHALRLYREATR